jgi:hypothetical protein
MHADGWTSNQALMLSTYPPIKFSAGEGYKDAKDPSSHHRRTRPERRDVVDDVAAQWTRRTAGHAE